MDPKYGLSSQPIYLRLIRRQFQFVFEEQKQKLYNVLATKVAKQLRDVWANILPNAIFVLSAHPQLIILSIM